MLANLDHAEIRHALMYDVFDRYLGGGTHDWSAEMLKMYTALHAQGEQYVAAELKKRVTGTHPTLPLAAYAGTYKDDLYGTIVIKLVDGKLFLDDPMDPSDVEHWNYDTFLLVHRKKWLGKQKVTFTFDADGNVNGLTPGGGIVLAQAAGRREVARRERGYAPRRRRCFSRTCSSRSRSSSVLRTQAIRERSAGSMRCSSVRSWRVLRATASPEPLDLLLARRGVDQQVHQRLELGGGAHRRAGAVGRWCRAPPSCGARLALDDLRHRDPPHEGRPHA